MNNNNIDLFGGLNNLDLNELLIVDDQENDV
jgi:hypothetical protein